MAGHGRKIEMRAGERFGSWVVVDPTPPDGEQYPSGMRKQRALVRCDCGAESMVPRGSLRADTTTSCAGCRAARFERNRLKRVGRVENGYRVIAVPDRWGATFVCLGCGDVVEKRYTDRSAHPQAPARCLICRPRVLTKEAKERTGVSREAIRLRLLSGWTVEEATTRRRGDVPERLLDARSRAAPRRFEHDGRCMTVAEWAAVLGVTPGTLSSRIRRRLPPERVFVPLMRPGRRRKVPVEP